MGWTSGSFFDVVGGDCAFFVVPNNWRSNADAAEPFQYSGDEVRFDTPAYIAMSWRRLEVIRKIMNDGYHVVFSDLDALWLKTPPFPFALQKNNWADMLLTMDRWYPDLDDIAPNSGLWFMRNTWRSRTFLKHWLDARSDLARGKRDQYALTSLLPAINEGVQQNIGINMLYVRPSVGGCMCDVPTSFVELSTIHADCVTGLQEKLTALTSFLERYEKGYNHYVEFSKQVIAKDLQVVAQEAMLPNKVVLTTSFLASEKPLLELFVDRLRKMKDKSIYADHLLVLTFDMAAYYYCNEMGLRCYFDSEAFPNMAPKDVYALRDLEKMVVWRRLALLETILNHEFKVLYSHPSVLWLKDPIPRVLSATNDMAIHCDHWSDIQAAASGNTSFWFVRNNGQAKQFLRRWMDSHKRWPELDDQQVFARIRPEVDEFTRKSINLHVAYLPPLEFGSFCEPTENVENLLTIHGDCVSYKERLGKLKEFLGRYDSGKTMESGEEASKLAGT